MTHICWALLDIFVGRFVRICMFLDVFVLLFFANEYLLDIFYGMSKNTGVKTQKSLREKTCDECKIETKMEAHYS